MARKKKGKIIKTASEGFSVIGDSVLVFSGAVIALLAKNIAASYIPASQQGFYPYAIELGSGIVVGLITHSVSGVSKPLLAGSLVAMGLTGVASMTANTPESNLFQLEQRFLPV
jgi:hypothetical protein